MKKGIHPTYRPVVFLDAAANYSFLSSSTVNTSETIKWTDGQEYPLYRVEISSASHPFFTGKMKLVDTAGRIERFQKKFANVNYGKKKEAAPAPAPEKKADDAK